MGAELQGTDTHLYLCPRDTPPLPLKSHQWAAELVALEM